jgi:hypothetical protein
MTTWIPRSSNLDQVDYDAEAKELTVTFKDGAAYLYRGVPATVFDSFQRAASPGSFFYSQVRSRYPYEEV